MNTREALREIEQLGGTVRDAGGAIDVSHPSYGKRLRVDKSRKDAPRALTVMLKRVRAANYKVPTKAPSKQIPEPMPWTEGARHDPEERAAMSLIDVDTQEKRVVLIERTCTVKIDRAGLVGLVRREGATELKRSCSVKLEHLANGQTLVVGPDVAFEITLSWVESEEHEGGTT